MECRNHLRVMSSFIIAWYLRLALYHVTVLYTVGMQIINFKDQGLEKTQTNLYNVFLALQSKIELANLPRNGTFQHDLR